MGRTSSICQRSSLRRAYPCSRASCAALAPFRVNIAIMRVFVRRKPGVSNSKHRHKSAFTIRPKVFFGLDRLCPTPCVMLAAKMNGDAMRPNSDNIPELIQLTGYTCGNIPLGMSKVQLLGYHCERCHHRWVPRTVTGEPRVCPKCKSPWWNTPKKRTTGRQTKNRISSRR